MHRIDGLDLGERDIGIRKRNEALVGVAGNGVIVVLIDILHDGEIGHGVTSCPPERCRSRAPDPR